MTTLRTRLERLEAKRAKTPVLPNWPRRINDNHVIQSSGRYDFLGGNGIQLFNYGGFLDGADRVRGRHLALGDFLGQHGIGPLLIRLMLLLFQPVEELLLIVFSRMFRRDI